MKEVGLLCLSVLMKAVWPLCACPNEVGMNSVTVSPCEGVMASVPVSPKVKEVFASDPVRSSEELQNSLIT